MILLAADIHQGYESKKPKAYRQAVSTGSEMSRNGASGLH